ncbi:integrase catalytic domain-containing protein [Trichonephila clavipes]|nr:integrase catalytic domain-containing protein [Trichonephila clavipes]
MLEDPETSQNLSLHVFCDASKAAYATCIFLRSENENSASCQLVQAGSRVAPLKSILIPRLELLACTIGARLARTVKEDLKLPSLPVFYWSDSTNALLDKEIGELGCFCIKQSQGNTEPLKSG